MILIESRPKHVVKLSGPQTSLNNRMLGNIKATITLLKHIGVLETELIHPQEFPEMLAVTLNNPQRRDNLITALKKRLPKLKPQFFPDTNVVEITHRSIKIGFVLLNPS